MCRNENAWDLLVTGRQLTLKLGAVHPGHAHVQDQTVRLKRVFRFFKFLGRSENLRGELDGSD
jgi:hypothetical protein